jgi:hypothetical protein
MATKTPATAATTASTINHPEVGRRFETFRRIERRIADLRRENPASGELRARGELQRAYDQALASVRELVDRAIAAKEEAERQRRAAEEERKR